MGSNRSASPTAVSRNRRSASCPRHTVIVVLLTVCAMVLAACSSRGTTSSTTPPTSATSSGTSGGGGPASPGVTASSVTVGQVDDLTSPEPSPFISARDGTEAYFAYINSLGGVNGRKLLLDSQDSTFQGGVVASETGAEIRNDFALVGGFSILDSAEQPLIDIAHMPDIALPLAVGMAKDPNVYSTLPNTVVETPLGFFKYLRSEYPQAVKKVGIIWENATPATVDIEDAYESGMKSVGFRIVYDHGAGVFDTNFLPDIIDMRAKGVKMFIGLELPDNFTATLDQQMQQQHFTPINIEGEAYSNQLLKLAGSAANGMYIYQDYALYLSEDAKSAPAIKLFVKWMNKVDPHATFAVESVYGWTSAELFADALKQAGTPPTRAGLVAALNKVTSFNSGGLIPLSDPAQNIPTNCFVLARVQNGQIKPVSPTPATGFDCPSGGYLPATGYKPMVRPTS
jgi:ABC-type branched-subunit amino acid transport system substrate-binding protein